MTIPRTNARLFNITNRSRPSGNYCLGVPFRRRCFYSPQRRHCRTEVPAPPVPQAGRRFFMVALKDPG